jgi:hypothetical protein
MFKSYVSTYDFRGRKKTFYDQAKIRLCRELAKTFIGVNRIEIYMYINSMFDGLVYQVIL